MIADDGISGGATLDFGDFQTIAIDDVQAQLMTEPSTGLLLWLGLFFGLPLRGDLRHGRDLISFLEINEPNAL